MAAEIPSKEPTSFIAGDSLQWDKTLADYPPGEGWQLAYALRGPVDLDIGWSAEVTAPGSAFEVRVPAATTAALTPGTYRLVGFVTKGTDRFVIHSESIHGQADPSTAVNALTADEIALAAIDATILGRATKAQASVQIDGHRVDSWGVDDLLKLQNTYRARVHRARNSGALTPTYEVEFGAPA